MAGRGRQGRETGPLVVLGRLNPRDAEGDAVEAAFAVTGQVGFYTSAMRSDEGRRPNDGDSDLIDAVPVLGRATTQLERSFGPSCLLSLIIVFLLAVSIRRFVQVGWIGMGVLLVVVWIGVLMLLVRWRPDRVVDEE